MDPSRNGPWWARLVRAAFTLDARSLAVYRIALGLIVGADALGRAADFDLMFAVDGVFPPDVVRRELGHPTAWSSAWLHDSNAWNAGVLLLEGVSGALLAAGVATRLATAAAWVAVVSVYRRTYPAANAGDAWLACQLFWSLFVPLGACWSWDARRRGRTGVPAAVCSVATAALVLQLVVVYVSAGIVKCNATWLDGVAVANALSVHNFGSPLGMAWADAGLFVPIALAAWLPILPAEAWRRGPASEPVAGLSRPATWACAGAMAVAAASLVQARGLGGRPPQPLAALVDLAALGQDWPMFGTVPPVDLR